MSFIVVIWRKCIHVMLVLLVTGCASTSVFSPYPNQAEYYKSTIGSDLVVDSLPAAEAALKKLSKDRDSADAMLYMMERGRIAQLSNNFDESKKDYEQVIVKFEEQDLAATVQAGELVAQGAAMLTNDNAIPYSGAGYERIFVHHQQALNYWAKGDLEGASVEFRKVALEQQVLLEQHEKELVEAQKKADKDSVNISSISAGFAGLDIIAGQVKSSFQNAYTFYNSATFWEATGNLNNALVDYKKAYEINPSVSALEQDIARVSKKMGVKVNTKDLNKGKADEGSVVILFEDGFVPAKTEIKINVPNPVDNSVISLAFPYYDTKTWSKATTLKIMDDKFNDFGSTVPIVDFGELAVKDLKEQMPKIIVRQVLRGFAKYQLQKQADDNLDIGGQIFANIYNIISESADRRSWLTLPNTGQFKRINLKSGERVLTFSAGPVTNTINLSIKENTTTVVRVVHVNNSLITQVFKI